MDNGWIRHVWVLHDDRSTLDISYISTDNFSFDVFQFFKGNQTDKVGNSSVIVCFLETDFVDTKIIKLKEHNHNVIHTSVIF